MRKKIFYCKKCSWMLNRTMIWNFPVWLLMCLFGWLMEMNSSTHKAHAYGLSKACYFMCFFRWFLEMMPSSHRAHSYEFSLVWIFICSFLRWVPGHTEHRDMDCPQAWLFMCLCILFQEMKHLPHRAHWYEFSTGWHVMCFFMWRLNLNPLSHRTH